MAIKEWFDNKCPYQEGVLLYATVPGCNKTLLGNFKRKESPQLHEKLKYELQKHLKNTVTVEPKVLNTPMQDIEVTPKTSGDIIVENINKSSDKLPTYFHELPEELRPVLLEANSLFKEMCLLKVQLNELPAHAEKKALAIQLEISKKQKINALCWKRIDYYKNHKVLLEEKEKEIVNLSPAEMLRKEQYLFAAISKLKKRVDENKIAIQNASTLKDHNSLSRKIAKQEANILNKETELHQLKELINGKG